MYQHLSDEELGAKIRANHAKHLERVAEMTPQWQQEGLAHKNMRKDLKITIKEISELTGACPQVISKFEHGNSIRSRNIVAQSYRTAMNYINSKRQRMLTEGIANE